MHPVKYPAISMAVLFTLVACTSMQPVSENSTTEEIVEKIKPGDEIRLVTKTGVNRHLTVSSISEGYIFAEEESYKLEDVRITDVKRLDIAETVGQTAEVVGTIGWAVLIQVLILAIVVGVAL